MAHKANVYVDIRIKRVKALGGQVRAIAEKNGLKENDVVLIKSTEHHSVPEYTVEKIEGDPIDFLFKPRSHKKL